MSACAFMFTSARITSSTVRSGAITNVIRRVDSVPSDNGRRTPYARATAPSTSDSSG